MEALPHQILFVEGFDAFGFYILGRGKTVDGADHHARVVVAEAEALLEFFQEGSWVIHRLPDS